MSDFNELEPYQMSQAKTKEKREKWAKEGERVKDNATTLVRERKNKKKRTKNVQ